MDPRLGGFCKSQQKSWNLSDPFWKEQLERRKTGRGMGAEGVWNVCGRGEQEKHF